MSEISCFFSYYFSKDLSIYSESNDKKIEKSILQKGAMLTNYTLSDLLIMSYKQLTSCSIMSIIAKSSKRLSIYTVKHRHSRKIQQNRYSSGVSTPLAVRFSDLLIGLVIKKT